MSAADIKFVFWFMRKKAAQVTRACAVRVCMVMGLPVDRLLDANLSDHTEMLDELIKLQGNDSVLRSIERRIKYSLHAGDNKELSAAWNDFDRRSKTLREQRRQRLRKQHPNTLEA